MKKMRVLSIVIAAAMLCAMLTGCFGGKTVMKIGDNAISEDIYAGALAYADMFFQQSYGLSIKEYLDQDMGGTTGADMLKEQADGLVKEFESVAIFAKEKGIELEKEDKDAIKEAKAAQIESVGGKKAFEDNLKANGMNEAFFDYMMERQQIYQKVYSELFSGEGEFAPSTESVIESLKGYARVKHVLIQAVESDADYAEKKATAQDVAKRAKAGEDFDALIAEFGEDPGMESNVEGYVIDAEGYSFDGSGQMITEFTQASHALAVDGVSNVVPSSYGFHIIKRYPFDAAYITENIDMYAYNAGSEAFMAELSKVLETVEVVYTDAYEKMDIHKMLGVEKVLGAGVEEHSADDGHDHSADAEGGIEVGEAVPAE